MLVSLGVYAAGFLTLCLSKANFSLLADDVDVSLGAYISDETRKHDVLENINLFDGVEGHGQETNHDS